MEFQIKILKEDRFEACNHCERGKLKEDGIGLEYDYDETYEFKIGNSIIKLCKECLKRFANKINDALSESSEVEK